MRTVYTALLLGAVLLLPTSADAAFLGVLGASKCDAAKLRCVAKAHSCLLTCRAKALGTGGTPDPECLAACRERLVSDPAAAGRGCLAHAERAGDCMRSGGHPTQSAAIDAHVDELLHALVPVDGAPENRCSAKKVRCIEKHVRCLLRLADKAAKAGTTIADASACTAILDGTPKSCVGKLERRYCDPAVPDCASMHPACLTYGDEQRLRLWNEAFADDVVVATATDARDVNTQRCTGDTAVRCTSAPGGTTGCGGSLGTCELFLGGPASQGWGGLPVCATTHWRDASGTYDQATGALAGDVTLVSRLQIGGDPAGPCPRCVGDLAPNDGVASGACSDGLHAGDACDTTDPAPGPSFGSTSLDCPPSPSSSASVVRLPLAFANDGTVTKTVTATSPTCNGAPGKRCVCASCSLDATRACESAADCAAAGAGTCTSAAGQPRKPNGCYDPATTVGDCVPTRGGDGVCAEGPFYRQCAAEPFRSCGSAADCPVPNDRCLDVPFQCYAGYAGDVGDVVTAVGRLGARRNGAGSATFAGLFCQPPTTNLFLDVAGLPGPGRIELAGVVADDGGAACPTVVTFLPTAHGPAVDVGWVGYAHDQKRFGAAKVTFATACTGAAPSCSCTIAGPVANAGAAP